MDFYTNDSHYEQWMHKLVSGKYTWKGLFHVGFELSYTDIQLEIKAKSRFELSYTDIQLKIKAKFREGWFSCKLGLFELVLANMRMNEWNHPKV